MSEEITFENPPRERLGRGGKGLDHGDIAAQLRKRPGIWAMIGLRETAANAGTAAWQIRNAKNMPYYRPAGAYEAMARTVDVIRDGVRVREHRVYVRFIGEDKDK